MIYRSKTHINHPPTEKTNILMGLISRNKLTLLTKCNNYHKNRKNAKEQTTIRPTKKNNTITYTTNYSYPPIHIHCTNFLSLTQIAKITIYKPNVRHCLN